MPVESIRIIIVLVFRSPAIDHENRSRLVADATKYAKRLLCRTFAVVEENDFNYVTNVRSYHGCSNLSGVVDKS
jgi:hypothetical protein